MEATSAPEATGPGLRPQRGSGATALATGLVLAVLLGLTALAWLRTRQAEEARLRADFEAQVHEAEARLRARMQDYAQVLRGAAALFISSDTVTREEFRRYVDSLRLEARYPGIQGVGMTALVPAADLAAHTQAMRSEGRPGYAVHPPGPRDVYTATVFAEPFTGRNLRALGYDPYSEPVRRSAMEKARDTLQPALSGRVTLAQETDEGVQAGVMLYLPIHQPGGAPRTEVERRTWLRGWVFMAFRMGDLTRALLGAQEKGLQVRLTDASAPTAGAVLFDAAQGGAQAPGRFAVRREVEVVDRTWTLEARSRPEFDARLERRTSSVVGAAGLAISGLLAALFWVVASGRDRALRLASGMTRQLADSEERLRFLMEQAADAFYLHDHAGRLREVNRQACESLGYTREELLRLGVTDVDTDFDLAQAQAVWDRLAVGERTTLRGRHRRKDGTTFPVEVRVSSLVVQGERLLFALARDVTARERAEQALRRLEAAVEQAPVSIVVTDAAGDIEYVNPAFERTTGYRRAEVLGRKLRLLDSGQHDEAFYREIWETVSAGRVWQGRVVNRARDGHLFTEDVVMAPVVDAGGAVRNHVSVRRDVTRELELQASLVQAQKLESVGRLAGGIAHDFNNLLTVLLSTTEVLREDLVEGKPLSPADLDDVIGAGRRAAELTHQLLAFARKQVIAPVPLDLGDVVRGARALVRRAIREDIRLDTKLTPGLWTVRADRGQLEQVLLNLAANARDAMPRGGTLTLSTHNVEAGEDGRAWVALCVRDTGEGFSPEAQAHLFEPFYTTKPGGKGTGLGLATVYGIVRQSGGDIRVESAPGRGTLFELRFPRHEGPAQAQPGPERPTSTRGSEPVLVVEDEPAVREVTVRALREAGYAVRAAAGGTEALELLAGGDFAPALLVTDVVMPGMNGRAVADAVLRLHPGVRVLFVSGYTQDIIQHQGVLDTGVEFLAKPFTAGSLLGRVRELLDRPAAPQRAAAAARG